jgi:hypothetical protein
MAIGMIPRRTDAIEKAFVVAIVGDLIRDESGFFVGRFGHSWFSFVWGVHLESPDTRNENRDRVERSVHVNEGGGRPSGGTGLQIDRTMQRFTNGEINGP